MTCQQARELLSAAQDDALAPDERATLTAHRDGCAACAAYERDLRTLARVLRGGARETTPPHVRARLEAAFRPRRRSRVLVAAVAAGAVAVFAFWITRPRGARVEEGALVLARAGATRAVSAGEPLRAGDVLRTQEGGARLRLAGDARVALGARTTVRLGERGLALPRGHARFEVTPGHGEFRVETPAGQVVVTGTAFDVDVLSIESRALDNKEDLVKKTTLGFIGAGAVGAVVLVHVTRGSVEVRGHGDALAVKAGESAEIVSGQPPQPVAITVGGRLADRLEAQNAALRGEVTELRAAVARQQALATVLPAPGHVQTTRDVRAPLSTDERKLLGAANLRASAETRASLAAIYQDKNGKPAPAEMDELALAKELIKDLRIEHIPALGSLPKNAGVEDMVQAGLPPHAARAMQLFHERNKRVSEELTKTLPPERAAAVANTIRATTHVGSSDGGKTVDSYVDLGTPPPEGEALPAPEAKK